LERGSRKNLRAIRDDSSLSPKREKMEGKRRGKDPKTTAAECELGLVVSLQALTVTL
jgi:hypothetical protein